jgi:hypothetical protein
LLAPHGKSAPLAAYLIVGNALLAAPGDIDQSELSAIVKEPLPDEDLIVLAALACRRAGGDVWNDFRAASKDLLGAQPFPGDMVVFINRLGSLKTSLAAREE